MFEDKKDKDNKKIKCLECGKSFVRPCSHIWQVHGLSARDYKALHGLDLKKGIATDEYKDRMREYVVINYDKVVGKNLIKNGKKARFKKGQPDVGVYERSQQTLERIRGYNRKRNPTSKRVTKPCGTCGKEITRTESYENSHKNWFCSRSCSTTAKNKASKK